jgi:hypothetical protein
LEPSRVEPEQEYDVEEDRPGFWCPAREAWIDNDFLWCELDPRHTYELMQRYAAAPHVEFFNAKSDDDLLEFVRTWGPLAIPDGSPVGKSILSIREYRLFQKKLKATSGLLHALQKGIGEGQALREFLILAEQRQQAISLGTVNTPSTTSLNLQMILQDDPLVRPLRRRYVNKTNESTRILASLLEWIATSSVATLRKAIADLINKECQLTARFYSSSQSGTISLLWDLYTLEDALVWMVYQGAVEMCLPQSCPECQKVFKSGTRHAKKFCSYKCAHRCASRRSAPERCRRQASEVLVSERTDNIDLYGQEGMSQH